jgi:hypothetical protein
MLTTLACLFLGCTQPLPSAPDDALFLAQGTGGVSVAYFCGNTFQFRNRSQDTVTVQWRVHGVQESGELFLAARGGAEFSETYLTTQERGPLQVSQGGQVLVTVPNKHTAQCEVPVTDTVPPSMPGTLGLPADTLISVVAPGQRTFKYYRNIFEVAFEDSTSGAQMNQMLRAFGASVIGGIRQEDGDSFYVLRVADPGASWDVVAALEERLSSFPGVRSARVVSIRAFVDVRGRYPVSLPVAEKASWWKDLAHEGTRPFVAIRAPLAWGCENGTDGVGPLARIGLVDVRFDANPEFANQVTRVGAPDPSQLVTDLSIAGHLGHGTGIAGIVSADGANGTQIAGMVWRSDLRLYSLGGGTPENPLMTADPTAQFAQDVAANGSAGTLILATSLGVGNQSQRGEIDRLRRSLSKFLDGDPRRLVVYALGNDGRTFNVSDVANADQPQLQALDRAIAKLALDTKYNGRLLLVSATDEQSGQKLPNSNVWLGAPTIAAPGGSIITVIGPSGLARQNGTSFAAAFVTGLAAMVSRADPTLTGAQIVTKILDGAKEPREFDAAGVGVPVADIGVAGVYQIDAYSTLRLVARGPQAPLCGNRITIEGREIKAERAPGTFETLATVGGTASIIRLLTFHGGRKFVVRNLGVDNLFTMQPGGIWSGPTTWDRDSTDLTGSAVSQYGETHDRDAVYFASGQSLWRGRRLFDFGAVVATLPAFPGHSEGGSEVCVRELVTDQGNQCQQTISTGFSQRGAWRQDVSTLGDSGVLLMREVYRDGSTYDPTWYNCYHPDQVWTEGTGCRFHWFSTTPTLQWTSIWKMDLASATPVPDSIGVIMGPRYPVGMTSAEDGSGFALASGIPNQTTGWLDGCYIQFYSLAASDTAAADPTLHYYGSERCDWLNWGGGFGATQEQVTSNSAPPAGGFALQARALRSLEP